ncbi:hypothetical protein [Butyrivibrio fibrisolvens]|uniref:hypothetical protein n=1 Tax=Butyrivibrio fibrisolvens TaxID=831 RepID=UPI00040F7086|nr:hypothetical protein [Butyrivibrio fibrisolvens]
MKLLFKDQILGTISELSKEGCWHYGKFVKSSEFNSFADFFEDIVCEEGFDEEKYDKELLNDRNWYVLSSDKKVGIEIPAIYSDGEISFRYNIR